MSEPYRIITVCTGNICRSPMAELMLQRAADAAELDVVVDSAGTSAWESGNPIDPRAAARLDEAGIDSAAHLARRFRTEWFAERDLILALDLDHFETLLSAAPDQAARAKVRMLRSFDPEVAGREAAEQGIADPWFGGSRDFDSGWRLIDAAIPGILAHVKREQVEQEQANKEQDRDANAGR
ncbi:MAG: low molecular weight phosphotyrosine protein phosphatase [Actinomycetota bacterium]|nr:low molecular weight phosphotyrosine protein phosphatase [Actinomycetota bacterium]